MSRIEVNDLTTLTELAELLGYTRGRIWQLTNDETIESVVIGNRHFYRKAVVEKLMRNGIPLEDARPYRSVGAKEEA